MFIVAVDVCIIGGGISGLSAALTIGERFNLKPSSSEQRSTKVVVLEADSQLGGRVRSDLTEDGYILDRGFAVFIEEYPISKRILDYESLHLKQFLPGALVKVRGRDSFVTVADPRRQPTKLFTAILTPLGTFRDKFRLVRLFLHVLTNTIGELFNETETDTKTCLKEKYGFSEKIIDEFFTPFYQGIFFSPLEDQSSRMFHFVLKMFAQGSASLPAGGMQSVSDQLGNKAQSLGIDVQKQVKVTKIEKRTGDRQKESYEYTIHLDGQKSVCSKTIILATDQSSSFRLLSTLEGDESFVTSINDDVPQQSLPQRSVGCVYYTFTTTLPVKEPILILNGDSKGRDNANYPVMNVCFPSAVNSGYAPTGNHLCSVSVSENVMEHYKNKEDELDTAIRKQLGEWFPKQKEDIIERWNLKRVYQINNAQPSQYKSAFPANVNGGRSVNEFLGKSLPDKIAICGDFMATATFNGALESGINAARAICDKIEQE